MLNEEIKIHLEGLNAKNLKTEVFSISVDNVPEEYQKIVNKFI